MKKNRPRIGRPAREPGEPPTKERILDAALRLFDEKGYAGATMRDIAKAAGLTEGALYRHYAGKEALLAAILDLFDAKIFEPLVPSDPGASIFRTLLGGLPGYFSANPRVARIGAILMNEARLNAGVRAYIREAMDERGMAAIAGIFESEMEAGRIIDCDTEDLAAMFNTLRVGWIFGTYLLDGKEYGRTERAKAELEGMIRVLERGYCVGGK